jgi:hypothetical protein
MNMKDLSLSSLRAFFGDLADVNLGSYGNIDVETPFQTKPHDFLRFAEYDLNNKYEHHLINALSNLKRAIDCQLDSLLFGFGLYDEAKKKKLSFPKKVVLMDTLGIMSPRILKRINQKRNLLEHEYICPAKGEVEDALDVANLFIAYTDKFIQRALREGQPANEKTGEWIDFGLDYKKKRLELTCVIYEKGKTRDIKKQVEAKDLEYLDYLKLFLSLYPLM